MISSTKMSRYIEQNVDIFIHKSTLFTLYPMTYCENLLQRIVHQYFHRNTPTIEILPNFNPPGRSIIVYSPDTSNSAYGSTSATSIISYKDTPTIRDTDDFHLDARPIQTSLTNYFNYATELQNNEEKISP